MSKEHQPHSADFQTIGRLFKVLSDPIKLHILYLLKKERLNVSGIVDQTGLKQAHVSKQLGLLHVAGLLGREREGSQVYYFIKEPLIFNLCELVCDKLERDAQTQLQLHNTLRHDGA